MATRDYTIRQIRRIALHTMSENFNWDTDLLLRVCVEPIYAVLSDDGSAPGSANMLAVLKEALGRDIERLNTKWPF